MNNGMTKEQVDRVVKVVHMWHTYQSGGLAPLRFGQAVCNEFGWHFPELYYTENANRALELAVLQVMKEDKMKWPEGTPQGRMFRAVKMRDAETFKKMVKRIERWLDPYGVSYVGFAIEDPTRPTGEWYMHYRADSANGQWVIRVLEGGGVGNVSHRRRSNPGIRRNA